MADQVGRLEVVLDARITQFEQKVKRAEDRMRSAGRGMQKNANVADRALEGMSRTMARLAGPAVIGGMIVGFDRMITKLDEIAKTADRLGLTTTELQEFRSAAQQAGVSVATFDMAMQRFGRRIAEARQGTGEAKGVVEELGLSLTDAEGRARPMVDVFREVASALGQMENATDRNRIAMKFFDSEGVALVNMFKDLDGAIEAYRAKGGPIEEDHIRNAEKLRNEIDLITDAIGVRLVNALGPAITLLGRLFGTYEKGLDQLIHEYEITIGRIAAITTGQEMARGPGELDTLRAQAQELKASIDAMSAAGDRGAPAPAPAAAPATVTSGGGGGESAEARAQRELEEASRRVAEQLVDETVKWTDLQHRIGLTGDELQDLVAEQEVWAMTNGAVTQETVELAENLIKVRREVEELQDAQEEAARASERQAQAMGMLSSRFADAIARGEDLEGVLRGVAASLIEMEMNALVQGTGGSILGSIFSGITGSLFGGGDGGGLGERAGGGSVSPNVPYMVGERGPEMFVPKSAGSVLNGAATRRAAGGITVNYAPVIDARGADSGAVARLQAAVAEMRATEGPRVVQHVRQAQRERRI